MAVFLVNSCKFSRCGLTFATLGDLIQHIEEIHIDASTTALEQKDVQQTHSLALSCVLRVFPDDIRKELPRPRPSSVSPVPSISSGTPTGSEMDEDEIQSEENDSDHSWTTQEEITSDVILSMIAKPVGEEDKPYACPVPGCKKRYKNINGIKYHAKHGHKKEVRVHKQFRCHCGKSYKSTQGLRSHVLVFHGCQDTPVSSTSITSAVKVTKVAPPTLVAHQPTVTASIPATICVGNMIPGTLKLTGINQLNGLSLPQLTQLTQVVSSPSLITPSALCPSSRQNCRTVLGSPLTQSALASASLQIVTPTPNCSLSTNDKVNCNSTLDRPELSAVQLPAIEQLSSPQLVMSTDSMLKSPTIQCLEEEVLTSSKELTAMMS